MCLANANRQANADLDTTHFGYLHSLRVDISTPPGCRVTASLGDVAKPGSVIPKITAPKLYLLMNEYRHFQLGDSYISILKVSVGKRECHSRFGASSENLMAELEAELGQSELEYLKIQVHYKHPTVEVSQDDCSKSGLLSHSTKFITTARAVIKQHNIRSSWMSTEQATCDSFDNSSSFFSAFEDHFPPAQHAEILDKIARRSTPFEAPELTGDMFRSKRSTWNSSTDTVVPAVHSLSPVPSSTRALSPSKSPRTPTPHPRKPNTKSQIRQPISMTTIHTCRANGDNDERASDPARKIWTEMRRSSRGGAHRSIQRYHCGNHSSSDSDVHIESSVGHESKPWLSGNVDVDGQKDLAVEKRKNEFLDAALRNKRSVGADTLRSFVDQEVVLIEGRGGGGWGWGPPWW